MGMAVSVSGPLPLSTSAHLMIHDDCRSVGCYAMTDDGIKELYAMVRGRFRGGNRTVQLQLLLFRMNDFNLLRHASIPHAPFWRNLKHRTDLFDATKVPPTVEVCEKRYVFNGAGAGGTRLDPNGLCPAALLSTMAAL